MSFKVSLQKVFHACLIRPFCAIAIGINIRGREKLPCRGPAIIAANHNSHLDTLVLMSLFPLRCLTHVRPVAAADYFFRNRLTAWGAKTFFGVIPIQRDAHAAGSRDPLAEVSAALESGEIVVLFPEGTRGKPEVMAPLKKGVAHLAERFPDVPVFPLFLYGLGKALPKGSFLLVPFFCDVFVGDPLRFSGSRESFMAELKTKMTELGSEVRTETWE